LHHACKQLAGHHCSTPASNSAGYHLNSALALVASAPIASTAHNFALADPAFEIFEVLRHGYRLLAGGLEKHGGVILAIFARF
jgi:hypothetical protein